MPFGKYGPDVCSSVESVAVNHEGRVAMVGIKAASPLALVDSVWTELPPGLPMFEESGTGYCACSPWVHSCFKPMFNKHSNAST